MKYNDLISIVLTLYNKAPYIEDAIFSVYQQTYTNWELIIVDDCSTDGSYEIAKSFIEKLGISNKCVLIKNESNLRVNKSTLKGLELSNGEYVCTLDGDDMFVKNKLERCLTFCKRNCVHMVHSDLCVFDDNNIIQSTTFNPWGHKNKKFSLKRTILAGPMTTSAIFLERELVDKIIEIGFPAKGVYQDQRINVCIAFLGYKIGYIKEPLVYYRKTPGALTYNVDNSNNNILNNRLKNFNTLKVQLLYFQKYIKTDNEFSVYLNKGIVICDLYLEYLKSKKVFPPIKLIFMSFNKDYGWFTYRRPIIVLRKFISSFSKDEIKG